MFLDVFFFANWMKVYLTVHDHCNSTPRTTSTLIPRRLSPNRIPSSRSFVCRCPGSWNKSWRSSSWRRKRESKSASLKRSFIDVPVPEVMEKTVEVGKHIRQEGKSSKSLVCHFHRLGRQFGTFRRNAFLIASLSTPPTFPARRFSRRKSVCSAGTELTSDRDFANAELSTAMEHTLRGVRRETQS